MKEMKTLKLWGSNPGKHVFALLMVAHKLSSFLYICNKLDVIKFLYTVYMEHNFMNIL